MRESFSRRGRVPNSRMSWNQASAGSEPIKFDGRRARGVGLGTARLRNIGAVVRGRQIRDQRTERDSVVVDIAFLLFQALVFGTAVRVAREALQLDIEVGRIWGVGWVKGYLRRLGWKSQRKHIAGWRVE